MSDETLPAICRQLEIPLARGERICRRYPDEIPTPRRVGIYRLFPREETLEKIRIILAREERCSGERR